MKIAIVLLPGLALTGCADTGTSSVANGQAPAVEVTRTTQGPAIPFDNVPQPQPCVLIQATTEPEGAKAERLWLHENYPGWKHGGVHSLRISGTEDHRRYFDYDQVITNQGDRITVCFEATNFYGKFK